MDWELFDALDPEIPSFVRFGETVHSQRPGNVIAKFWHPAVEFWRGAKGQRQSKRQKHDVEAEPLNSDDEDDKVNADEAAPDMGADAEVIQGFDEELEDLYGDLDFVGNVLDPFPEAQVHFKSFLLPAPATKSC